ncbi:hypothetical protein B0H14DRAFT_3131060 [Mycena olivaceomarginata]|nr:hypothetical protein B0H14DRAFT_3131060 [Mycena olivaceomarginata]
MAAGQRGGVGKTEDGVATTEETHAVGRARGRDSIAKGLGTETKDHQGRLVVEMGRHRWQEHQCSLFQIRRGLTRRVRATYRTTGKASDDVTLCDAVQTNTADSDGCILKVHPVHPVHRVHRKPRWTFSFTYVLRFSPPIEEKRARHLAFRARCAYGGLGFELGLRKFRTRNRSLSNESANGGITQMTKMLVYLVEFGMGLAMRRDGPRRRGWTRGGRGWRVSSRISFDSGVFLFRACHRDYFANRRDDQTSQTQPKRKPQVYGQKDPTYMLSYLWNQRRKRAGTGHRKKLLAQAQAAQALTLSDNHPPSSPVSTGLRYAQGHSAYDSDSDSSRSGDSFHSRIESSKNHNDAEMEDGEDGNDLEREEEDFSAPSDSVSIDFTIEIYA